MKLALYDVLYTNFLTNNELEKVNILLQKNMYPKSVIDKQIKTFLDKQFTEDKDITSEITKNFILKLTIYWTFFSSNKKEIKTYL